MPAAPQTVDKAIRLLVELSRRRNLGWRLTDIARECRLDPATAHRLLAGLAAHGLVARRAADRHFIVGPELLNLGLAASYHTDFVRSAEAAAREVVTETREVAFVFVRGGNDFVCVARAARGPLKALSIEVGTRRPLLLSAGGVAMLLTLPATERNAIVAENLARLRRAKDARVPSIERMLRRSVRLGYGLNRGDIVPGITAIGVGIELPSPWGCASVLVAGASDNFAGDAVKRAVQLLRRAAGAVREGCVAPG
jgi:DNA-binding IclR family transcriptional regulator